MIVVVCSAVIRQGDKTLFVRETKASAAGKWGLPGGKLEEGENLLACLHREVLEETGYAVVSQALLRIVNKSLTHEGNTVVRFIFTCQTSSDRQTGYEHETAFLSKEEVHKLASQEMIRGKEVPELAFCASQFMPADLFTFITS